jgi:hypothetical protein
MTPRHPKSRRFGLSPPQIGWYHPRLPRSSHTGFGWRSSATAKIRVRQWLWCAVVLFGIAQAWASRFAVDADGVSYADIADAFNRGDWQRVINACWSPLYPALLSVAFRVFRPSVFLESTVIHALNFALYLGCFAALLYLVREMKEYVSTSSAVLDTVACLLFLLMAQHYVQVIHVKPDMLVTALCFVAGGLVLRIKRLGISGKRLAQLGLVLGVGYLAKAIMFPLAPVYIATALIGRNRPRMILSAACAATLVFAAISAPLVWTISRQQGHFSIGESGQLNYLIHINGMGYADDDPPGDVAGHALHAPRKIFSSPNAYEFAGPISGTYPAWFDPAYWHQGERPRFLWSEELNCIKESLSYLRVLFFHESGLLIVWLALMFLTYRNGLLSWSKALAFWRLSVPALIAFLIYIPLHLESRYVGWAVVMIQLAVFFPLLDSLNPATARIAALAITASVGVILGPHFVTYVTRSFRPLRHVQWEVAIDIRKRTAPADPVGCLDCLNMEAKDVPEPPFIFGGYWARLAGVRIIAEIPPSQLAAFRDAAPSRQELVLQQMLRTGAKIIIAYKIGSGPNWHPVGNTGFSIYSLPHGD